MGCPQGDTPKTVDIVAKRLMFEGGIILPVDHHLGDDLWYAFAITDLIWCCQNLLLEI